VNDGKLTDRLRNGGRITTDTLERVRAFMVAHGARLGTMRGAIIERDLRHPGRLHWWHGILVRTRSPA